MEKGYRYFGTDLTMLDTPFEAGLGFAVALGVLLAGLEHLDDRYLKAVRVGEIDSIALARHIIDKVCSDKTCAACY